MGVGTNRTNESSTGITVAEELLSLGEELYRELKDLSIEAPEVDGLLKDAKIAMEKGNIALATAKATEACTLGEHRKSEGIIQIVGSKVAEIKDFIRSVSFETDVAGVREYLARGEDELILGHYDEANKFLDIGVNSIQKVRRQIDKKKILGLITRAETASHKKFINDPDGRIQGMLEKSKELLENGEPEKASEMAYEVLNRCSEESKYGEMQSLLEELGSIESEIEELEKLGAEVKAVNIRLLNGKQALDKADIESTRDIISSCYIIISRLKGRVKIKAAQERLARAKYVVDQMGETAQVSTEPLEKLGRAKNLFHDKKYDESIECSDDAINTAMEVKHKFYKGKIFSKIEEYNLKIEQLEKSGLSLDELKSKLSGVAQNAAMKKYLECENMLENISLELLKEKNNLRIKKGSSDISSIQVDLRKLKILGLPMEELTDMLTEAQKAFKEYDYRRIEELAEKVKNNSEKMIRDHKISESIKKFEETEKRLEEIARQDVDVSKAWMSFNKGRSILQNGDYTKALESLRAAEEQMSETWGAHMLRKIDEIKGDTDSIISELRERGLKVIKAEKLLQLAELKVRGKDMEAGYQIVKDALDSAKSTKSELFRRMYLDTLLDYHTHIKALQRGGVDTSSMEERLNEAKTKVENEDFGDLTSLMNGILESINSKKQEYLGGQSSQKLKDMQDRYKELEKEGIELDEVSGLMEDAASAHEKGNYETAKTLLSEARQKAENNYILTKSSAFKDTYDSILKDIGKWKEASIDTAELERIIEDARNKIELKEMEMASKDLDQAMEISSRLREYYYQERSLDIISEAKITFRDLIEVGQDISSLRGQLDRVKEYFSDQQYKEAYELGEELTSTIKARRRLGTLQKKNQLLVKRHAELENEGLELDEEKDVLSQVAVMLDAAEFDTAKETIEKIDRVMEEKFHSYRDDFYRKEIDEFKSLLDKFSKKDVDVSSLYSIIDNCTRHLEMKEYNTTAELLKKGWMEAESARDFFVTNQLLTQLYELEDALFELANRGADVTGMDSKLLKIKRMISKGSFSEARSAILKRQKDIREIEIDFHRGKVRIFLDELETQRQSLSEEGVDTMEMETLLVAAESNVSKGIFDEAYKVIDKVKKIRDSLELDHKLGNSESSLDTVKEELDRLSTKGVDTDLMGDLYRDAGELLKKNNFSEVNAYCKLALKEGAKREREFDLEIALDRLSRSRGVVEFIEKDSGGGFDLSDYFDRLDELNDEVREEVSTEILARIVQFEDDVRGRSREYMKQKAISTKRLLEDIISEIEEIGGASSPLMVYIQKGEKLLDKEHFGPSIEWFQKGIEKAAFEKRRQEICLSIDNIRTLEEDARKIGVDVSEGSSLFNKGKREFKREDYDKSVILLERAKKAITSAKFNYLKTKINGVIITNKLIYDNLTEMGVSKIEMKEEKSFMDMSQLLLDKGVLDEAEVYVNKGKEALVDLKNRHNLRIVSEEMEKTSDICSGIEEQGVEISSSLQLLGEIRETLGDRKELPDDEQRSILDDIRHALHSAREQETTFKLHLLDSNLERNAALLNKYSMEGVDMTEPLAILAEAREMYDGGNTEKGLAKGIECIALAKEKRALFFKDSANGLLYTAELLMKDIRKLPFDISHLESMMKTARDNYAEEKHRKCAHQLKPFISACDEMRIMGELQAKIDALRESVIDLPIEKEHFEEELKEIEELIVNRKFDAAKNAYEDIFKVFKLKRGEYEKKLAEEEYERIKLQVDELTADGIDQSEPINMIEQGRKFIKNGELNKGHDIIMEAAQLAKKIRKEKTAEISEAILSLEDALILAGEGRAYEAELMKKLRKLRDDSAIPITEELTQTILSLSKIFKMMEDYEIKTLFLGNVQSVRKLLSEVSEYLPEEISRELNVKLDGMPSLGPGVPRSVEDEAFGELEKIRNLIIASTEKEIHKSLADPVARIEQLGGVDKLLAQGIVGVDIYNSYLNKINDTSGEELVDKLRFVRLLSEQVEKIELRVQRKNLLDHYNDLSQRVNAMKSNQFTPSSALHWLGEGKAALDSDEFKEAEKCFVRAEDGANMALKRREQDMASRSITSAIEKMRGMGLKFSEAKEVQVILIKAQEAERQRRYSEIQGLCKEAIGLATKEIDRKRKEKFEKETSRIKNIIKSKDRDMDGSIHLNRLVMAENLFNSGMYDLAMDVAKRAEKDVRNSYWLTMTEKYLISHQEAEKAMENAETIEVDISQGALLMEESRKLFLKEAMALAYENISEATSVINELIHRNMVRTKQDEATSLRKELDILEEKGAEVLNARRDLEKMRVLLKQGELDKAEEVKNIIVNALGGLEKDVFREELKRILDNCHAIMEEVARMKGDTSEFQKNIKRATDFLTGGLLESANELSQACLKELMGERNSLLEERAKTVLYATGEIVNGTENERALDYFKKARTAFELERYKEALRMAQESIKHIEG